MLSAELCNKSNLDETPYRFGGTRRCECPKGEFVPVHRKSIRNQGRIEVREYSSGAQSSMMGRWRFNSKAKLRTEAALLPKDLRVIQSTPLFRGRLMVDSVAVLGHRHCSASARASRLAVALLLGVAHGIGPVARAGPRAKQGRRIFGIERVSCRSRRPKLHRAGSTLAFSLDGVCRQSATSLDDPDKLVYSYTRVTTGFRDLRDGSRRQHGRGCLPDSRAKTRKEQGEF